MTAATESRAGPKRSAPGRQISGPASKLRLLGDYHLWAALQRPSRLFFGRLNSVTARIADELANEGIEA